jgi:hypothetical protein
LCAIKYLWQKEFVCVFIKKVDILKILLYFVIAYYNYLIGKSHSERQ